MASRTVSPPEYPDATIGAQLAPPPAAPGVVSVEGAAKSFGDLDVLKDVNLNVRRGEIVGLVGPSGCGKTTLVKLLTGLQQPTDGLVRVLDCAPADFDTKHRKRIGYTPQGFFLYPSLSVEQNARFVAGLYGLGWRRRRRRTRQVLQFLELWDARKRLARDISGGMQRRLSLACALLHSPEVLFIDEPTAGLDPLLRTKIWEHLRELCNTGCTILVTTQYMDEAAYCDRVAVMRDGGIAVIASPEELRRKAFGGDALDIRVGQVERADIVALWNLPCVQQVEWLGRRTLRLTVDDTATATVAVTDALHDRGTELEEVRPYNPSFDEIFTRLVDSDD
ncbi:MAG: ABC transporter ATP-binding protein [Dehalococcoidia bacterium]|nr:ABC transporter ATP-binding protein [Dehalococcoidia bacterium]